MKFINVFFLIFLFFCITSKAQSTQAKPFVLGIVEEIQSKELNEKRIIQNKNVGQNLINRKN